LIGIEEVAERNNVTLVKTSRPGQWKAHCPSCGDKGRKFHLYVSSNKDTFFCHKCGERGGVVAFHAWLKGLDFGAAKLELFPPIEGRTKKYKHPAEALTKSQLTELGFTYTPKSKPKNVVSKQWRDRRRAELDWIWSEWCEYQTEKQKMEQLRKESDERLRRAVCLGMGIDLDAYYTPEVQTSSDVTTVPTMLRIERIDLAERRRVSVG